MELGINDYPAFEIRDIYEPINLLAGSRGYIVICERDGGFEIRMPIQSKDYRVDFDKGVIEEIGCNQ